MIVNATTARNNLFGLIDEVLTSQEPVYITSKRGNVVVLSEEDYRSISETLYLSSIPGMREKILAGGAIPLSECIELNDD
jgi:prevent-host-death family protein